MPPIKPGYKTSELWLTVGFVLAMVLVAVGLIPAKDQTDVGQLIAQGVAQLAALVLSGKTALAYMRQRHEAKQAAEEEAQAPGPVPDDDFTV